MFKLPIIIFGIVIPIFVALMLIGAFAFVKAKIVSSFDEKALYYSGYEKSRMEGFTIEAQLKQQRLDLEKWKELTEQETFSLVTTNLRAIGESLPPKEFQQTAFERLNQSSGFGNVSKQKSSGLKFNLRGTYRTVQKAFLELETRMPNLQLQELKIDPNATADQSLLNFQVTYTAWEQ